MIRSFIILLLLGGGAACAGDLPNHKLTPGKADSRLTKEILCAKDFTTQSIRNVSEAVKRQVFATYHVTHNGPNAPFEVDHLISLELGGSNDIKNLWPQSYVTKPWNAHIKDALENHLHKLVCGGELELAVAQKDIAFDWIALYKKHF